jgi:hypothetical protein
MIECYGLAILFDPVWTLFESLAFGYYYDDWDADSFKLWNYFHRVEGNGVVGLFLTVFLYLFVAGITLFFLYTYIIFVHMNGRLIDIYRRLTATEDEFFTPHDSEVSRRYFDGVCFRAENYRSLMGETQKISVTEFEAADPSNPEDVESTLHIVIYKVAKDKARTIHRHFVKTPNNAIIEIPVEKQENKTLTRGANNLITSFFTPAVARNLPLTNMLIDNELKAESPIKVTFRK